MAKVSLRNVSAQYHGKAVVDDLSLEIGAGEFVVLLGPSGCGKTTTLRMLAGFVQPSSGKVLFDDADVTRDPPRRREIGMVFQNYALFPTMTVEQNIGFPLRSRKRTADETRRRVGELMDMVRLAHLAKNYPDELSGGQQQRVAVARALAASPKLLLLDEPLGALDQKLRDALQLELHKLQRDLGITTLLVTHDQQEAMLLADRIVIMSDGRIQQVGSPLDLYRNPANRFVADFIGRSNILSGTIESGADGHVLRDATNIAYPVRSMGTVQSGQAATLIVRPETISLMPRTEAQAGLHGVIERQVFLGSVAQYYVRTSPATLMQVELHGDHRPFGENQQVILRWDPSTTPLFLNEAGS